VELRNNITLVIDISTSQSKLEREELIVIARGGGLLRMLYLVLRSAISVLAMPEVRLK
jgi:hypothetical protein